MQGGAGCVLKVPISHMLNAHVADCAQFQYEGQQIISDAILYLWAMAFLCHKLGRHSFTWRGSPYNL